MSNLSEHEIFYAHFKVMWSFSYILRSLGMNAFKMVEASACLSMRFLSYVRIILWPIKWQIYVYDEKEVPLYSEAPSIS